MLSYVAARVFGNTSNMSNFLYNIKSVNENDIFHVFNEKYAGNNITAANDAAKIDAAPNLKPQLNISLKWSLLLLLK